MYQLVLLSITNPIILGIYCIDSHENLETNGHKSAPQLICMLRINGKASDVLPLLFAPFCLHEKKQNLKALATTSVLHSCVLESCVLQGQFLSKNIDVRHFLESQKIPFSLLDSKESMPATPQSLYNDYGIAYNARAQKEILESLPQFVPLACKLEKILELLTFFNPIDSIYYARGVGSLSSIKLTHVFLHTLSLTKNIPLYATNSFYFSRNKEIKAFGAMSFFLDSTQHIPLTDENAKEYIRLAPSLTKDIKLHLPLYLMGEDFLESCTPLYVTPAV